MVRFIEKIRAPAAVAVTICNSLFVGDQIGLLLSSSAGLYRPGGPKSTE